MKKFLKLLARHCFSIPAFFVCVVIAIVEGTAVPVIIWAVCCIPGFIATELAWLTLKWERGFWTALYNIKKHEQS